MADGETPNLSSAECEFFKEQGYDWIFQQVSAWLCRGPALLIPAPAVMHAVGEDSEPANSSGSLGQVTGWLDSLPGCLGCRQAGTQVGDVHEGLMARTAYSRSAVYAWTQA